MLDWWQLSSAWQTIIQRKNTFDVQYQSGKNKQHILQVHSDRNQSNFFLHHWTDLRDKALTLEMFTVASKIWSDCVCNGVLCSAQPLTEHTKNFRCGVTSSFCYFLSSSLFFHIVSVCLCSRWIKCRFSLKMTYFQIWFWYFLNASRDYDLMVALGKRSAHQKGHWRSCCRDHEYPQHISWKSDEYWHSVYFTVHRSTNKPHRTAASRSKIPKLTSPNLFEAETCKQFRYSHKTIQTIFLKWNQSAL